MVICGLVLIIIYILFVFEIMFVSFGQHVVFVVKFFVAWLIPDVPSEVKDRIKHERYLVQEFLRDYDVKKITLQLSKSPTTDLCHTTESSSLLNTDMIEVLSECI